MHKTIDLTCDGCGTSFNKSATEIKRQRKKKPDRRFFCTRSCFGTHAGDANLGPRKDRGNVTTLRANNRQDNHSPFRYYMNKARNRRHSTDLDLPYLKALWEQQGGICPLSGFTMDLPPNTLAWANRAHDPWKPSLDRIDCSKGYIKGNVRFVTVIANMALQSWGDELLFQFCRMVSQAHPEAEDLTPACISSLAYRQPMGLNEQSQKPPTW